MARPSSLRPGRRRGCRSASSCAARRPERHHGQRQHAPLIEGPDQLRRVHQHQEARRGVGHQALAHQGAAARPSPAARGIHGVRAVEGQVKGVAQPLDGDARARRASARWRARSVPPCSAVRRRPARPARGCRPRRRGPCRARPASRPPPAPPRPGRPRARSARARSCGGRLCDDQRVHEVAPGIAMVDTLLGGTQGVTSVYLVSGDRPALVDAGARTTAQTVRDALAAAGIGANDLALDRADPRPPRSLRRHRDPGPCLSAGAGGGAPPRRPPPLRARPAGGGLGGGLRRALVALRRPRRHPGRPHQRRRGRPPRPARARAGPGDARDPRPRAPPHVRARRGHRHGAGGGRRGPALPRGPAPTRRCRRRTSTRTPATAASPCWRRSRPPASASRTSARSPIRRRRSPLAREQLARARGRPGPRWRRAAGTARIAAELARALPLEPAVGDPAVVARWRDLGWAAANVDGLAAWAQSAPGRGGPGEGRRRRSRGADGAGRTC